MTDGNRTPELDPDGKPRESLIDMGWDVAAAETAGKAPSPLAAELHPELPSSGVGRSTLIGVAAPLVQGAADVAPALRAAVAQVTVAAGDSPPTVPPGPPSGDPEADLFSSMLDADEPPPRAWPTRRSEPPRMRPVPAAAAIAEPAVPDSAAVDSGAGLPAAVAPDGEATVESSPALFQSEVESSGLPPEGEDVLANTTEVVASQESERGAALEAPDRIASPPPTVDDAPTPADDPEPVAALELPERFGVAPGTVEEVACAPAEFESTGALDAPAAAQAGAADGPADFDGPSVVVAPIAVVGDAAADERAVSDVGDDATGRECGQSEPGVVEAFALESDAASGPPPLPVGDADDAGLASAAPVVFDSTAPAEPGAAPSSAVAMRGVHSGAEGVAPGWDAAAREGAASEAVALTAAVLDGLSSLGVQAAATESALEVAASSVGEVSSEPASSVGEVSSEPASSVGEVSSEPASSVESPAAIASPAGSLGSRAPEPDLPPESGWGVEDEAAADPALIAAEAVAESGRTDQPVAQAGPSALPSIEGAASVVGDATAPETPAPAAAGLSGSPVPTQASTRAEVGAASAAERPPSVAQALPVAAGHREPAALIAEKADFAPEGNPFRTAAKRQVSLVAAVGLAILTLGVGVLIGSASSSKDGAAAAASAAPGASAVAVAPTRSLLQRVADGDDAAFAELERVPAASRSVAQALALAEGQSAKARLKFEAFAKEIQNNSRLAQQPAAQARLMEAAKAPSTAMSALKTIAELKSAAAADMLYELWTGTAERTLSTTTAEVLVATPELRAAASPALRVALDLRASAPEACDEKVEILQRLKKHGDDRSAHLVNKLLRRFGCGPKGQQDCHACLRGTPLLKDAIYAVRERKAPRF